MLVYYVSFFISHESEFGKSDTPISNESSNENSASALNSAASNRIQ
eukprot:IDg2666t1